jgi:hypothetical protein
MTDRTVHVAAIGAGTLILAVAAFQLALALGAPFGDATVGGNATTQDGVLSSGFRIVAAASALLLLPFAWIALARAGIVDRRALSPHFVYWATWIIVAYVAINALRNLTASHPLERWGAGLTTLVLVILCGFVALLAPNGRN